MKYIIMCGGHYPHLQSPRQLWTINGETILARTIRLLRAEGINDIYISYNEPIFEEKALEYNVGVVKQDETEFKRWVDGAFPVLTEPICYIMGDVVFSPAAIKTIVEAQTDDIEFFASAAPFHADYIKTFAEPFAIKVVNYEHMKQAIKETRDLFDQKILLRCIAWELWQVIKHTPLNNILVNYTAIRDYSCDVDNNLDLQDIGYKLRNEVRTIEEGNTL